MATTQVLHPTLWRTCRVLANRTRLQILELLVQEEPQTVSAVAGRLRLTLPVASQALRALESRGLLACRRVGRRVEYRFGTDSNSGSSPTLVETLRTVLQCGPASKETIFRLATAFTHPRRIEIFRLLQTAPRMLIEVQTATRISPPALARHLRKLEDRAYVICEGGQYSTVNHPESLGRLLGKLAASQ